MKIWDDGKLNWSSDQNRQTVEHPNDLWFPGSSENYTSFMQHHGIWGQWSCLDSHGFPRKTSVSMLVESPKVINQSSFLSYICDASIIYIFIYIYMYTYMNPIQLGWWKVRYEFCRLFPPPPPICHQPRSAAEPRPGPAPHDGPWRHWRCGSCRSNDRLHSPGSLAATPKMWENGLCIMGISW